MEFEQLPSEKDDCDCVKVRAIQMTGRFDKQGKPIRADGNRGNRTSKGTAKFPGWRIDWPDNLEGTAVPYLDNLPGISNPYYSGGKGTVNAPPEVTANSETFKAYTCFIGEKSDGTLKLLGCFYWGFVLTDRGRRATGDTTRDFQEPTFKVLDKTPSWSCDAPESLGSAISQWNHIYGTDVQIPNFLPQ